MEGDVHVAIPVRMQSNIGAHVVITGPIFQNRPIKYSVALKLGATAQNNTHRTCPNRIVACRPSIRQRLPANDERILAPHADVRTRSLTSARHASRNIDPRTNDMKVNRTRDTTS